MSIALKGALAPRDRFLWVKTAPAQKQFSLRETAVEETPTSSRVVAFRGGIISPCITQNDDWSMNGVHQTPTSVGERCKNTGKGVAREHSNLPSDRYERASGSTSHTLRHNAGAGEKAHAKPDTNQF
jgi:hypothetical protein